MSPYFRIFTVALFVFLIHLPQADSAVIKAASCSQSDVQTSINLAHDGDTVNIPAGSCTWTSPVTTKQAIHLHGAGYTGTAITKIASGLGNTIIFNLSSCTSSPEIDGFLFVDSNSGGATDQGVVSFGGTCDKIKAHDNKLTHSGVGQNNFFFVHNYVFGVIYHNIMDNTTGAAGGGFFEAVVHDTWNGGKFGDGSWVEDKNYTGTNSNRFLYVEGNTYTNTNRSGFSDMDHGARVVERYNTIVNGNPNSHGFDSGGRTRAVRIKTVYNNSISGPSNFPTCLQFRGGTGLMYGNQIDGWQNANCISSKTYRNIDWNTIDGLNNGSKSLSQSNFNAATGLTQANGMCSKYDPTNTNNFCFNNATGLFDGNCTGAHYMCKTTVAATGNAGACTGPKDTRCTGGLGNCIGPVDNPSGTGQGPVCRDAIGRGKDSGLGTPQASEPLFVWNNAGTFNGVPNTPRPLHASTDAIANTNYFTDGTSCTSGVTSGLDAAKCSTCKQGVGYWATDTRQLYQCGANNTWSVHYSEYACPNPLTGLTGKCNPGVAGAAGYPSTTVTVASPSGLRTVQ